MKDDLQNQFIALYGEPKGQTAYLKLEGLLQRYADQVKFEGRSSRGKISQDDAVLITYGDQVTEQGCSPISTLSKFCDDHLDGFISGIHILPFFPYSSDDGFSVMDYREVDPSLGSWEDIACLRKKFRLMFDAVINHVSVKSQWFEKFLQNALEYKDYFIVVEGNPDISKVVRPRTLPLLTTFDTPSGPKAVWTTFSSDQVDLNYANPDVMLEIVDLLLFYISKGAEFIRLDAIAYIWKEIGTSCVHQPQTHLIIKLIRSILDLIAPWVFLITETNVPHTDNISYWGSGCDEAQMVYNFALPPLVLHTLQTGDAAALNDWAKTLILPSNKVTFFNFLASHDGIGLNPVRGILTDEEIEAIVDKTLTHNGLVSYKQNPDGSQSPYELNINYFDAVNDPRGGEPLEIQIDRFMVAQAIMLSLVGMPGIYFHSIFGSTGWQDGYRQTGRTRSINRQKFLLKDIESELLNPASRPHQVLIRFQQMLKIRSESPAFDPIGEQQVLDFGKGVFAILRTAPNKETKVLCIHNATGSNQKINLAGKGTSQMPVSNPVDILSGTPLGLDSDNSFVLKPYQVIWLA